MSRIIHCFGRNATSLLRSYPIIYTPTATRFKGFDGPMNCIITSRNLFTENALGIAKLDTLRSNKHLMFAGGARERYIERLKNYVECGDSKSIYKDDLVNLLGIAESEQDLELLEKILENSTEEQRTFFGGWGTSVMRLYYKMNRLDLALKNIEDTERFGDFFNMPSCYKIVMTMLYDDGQYQRLVDLFRLSEKRLTSTAAGIAHTERTGELLLPTRDLFLLSFAALARIGTPESFQEAKALLARSNAGSIKLGLRPASLVAYLAVISGDPKYALNLISTVPARNYVSLRDTKIVALLKLERFDDVVIQIRDYATSTKSAHNQLLRSTFEELKKSKENIKDPATRQELDDILIEVESGKHVSDETLDSLIFRQIEHERQAIKQRENSQGYRQAPFNQRSRSYRDNQQSNERSRYNDEDRYQPREREEDSYRSRRDAGGKAGGSGGYRNDRKFSFQNVEFET